MPASDADLTRTPIDARQVDVAGSIGVAARGGDASGTGRRRSSRRRHGQWGIVLAATVAAVIPLLGHGLPGLIDLPNNVARLHIQARCAAGSWYAGFYAPNSLAIPNAAFDLFGRALGAWLDPVVLGQLFAVLAAVLTTTGAAALARALGHGGGLAAVLAAAMAHNFASTTGFLNYTVGLGLAMWGAWGWIVLRKQGWPVRWLAGSVMTVALYSCHLLALGTYAALVLGIEAGRVQRRRLPLVAATLAPAVILVSASPLGGEARSIDWATPWETLRACAKALHGGLGTPDYVHAFLLVGLAIALCWSGRVRITKVARVPLLLLVVATLLCPSATFEASALQARMPIAVLLVAAAALRWRRGRGPWWVVPAVAVAVVGFRTVTLAQGSRERAAAGARAERVLSQVPERACLYTLHRFAADPWSKYRAPIKHAACLVALDRAVFLPQLLVADHHHTLRALPGLPWRLHQQYETRAGFASNAGLRLRVEELATLWRASEIERTHTGLTHGLYLVVVHGGDDLAPPLDLVDRVAAEGDVVLLRLRE